MPAGSPFTRLCELAARPKSYGRADLHLHSTASDGRFSPAQLVEQANRAGLCAIAVTDHDTLAAVGPARAAATKLEVIAGVEITTEFRGRELHLLGLFVRPDDPALNAALAPVQERRVERYCDILGWLSERGLQLPTENGAAAPGRRQVAQLLKDAGHTDSIRAGFTRYLNEAGRAVRPKLRLPVADAIALVRQAGGIAGWAHPPDDPGDDELAELRSYGLGAVEAHYPSRRPAPTAALKLRARAFGLSICGGSDCHGPDIPGRHVGACGLSAAELTELRQSAQI